jgi:hypothetical protein
MTQLQWEYNKALEKGGNIDGLVEEMLGEYTL